MSNPQPTWLDGFFGTTFQDANGAIYPRRGLAKLVGFTIVDDPTGKRTIVTGTGLVHVYPGLIGDYPFQALIGQRVFANANDPIGSCTVKSPDSTNAREGDRFGVTLVNGGNATNTVTVTSSFDPNGADLQDASNMLFDDTSPMSTTSGVFAAEWVYSVEHFRWYLASIVRFSS